MNTLARTLIVSALITATGLASAGPRHDGHWRHHHHHHHHRGSHVGGLAVGLAVAIPLIALAHHANREPEVVYAPSPAPLPPPAPVYAPPRPDPVIYPRHGQGSAQLEADSRECNRWATTQPAAMADAGVFHRAVEACMDGRGYTLR